MKSHSSRNNILARGFTLIELLVVIAIIAILAAILFPVFAQAKLAAKKSQGLSQMKQIGTASMMYAADNDDGLPTYDSYYAVYPDTARGSVWAAGGSVPEWKRTWDALLMPYVKSGDFDKKAARANVEFAGIWKSPGAEYAPARGRSIGINQLVAWDPMYLNDGVTADPAGSPTPNSGKYYWLNNGQVEKPADTMLAGDTGTYGRIEPLYYLNGYQETFLTKPALPLWSRPWRYGTDSANYVYLDGHASSQKGNKIIPNPGPNVAFPWATAVVGQVYCSAAKYQAPTPEMRQYLAGMARTRNVTCEP
jgi:prepilin-type N-terminal cleavage/methylation domain-containing protein/prepilin-type processing-associated H-X9-DG protein